MKTLYYPIMSRFDLYVGAVDQTGLDPKDIAENTLYYNGCITWTLGTEPNSFFQNGLGINGKKYFIQLIDPGVATFSNADGGMFDQNNITGKKYSNFNKNGVSNLNTILFSNQGFKGISYTILTDNKTYFLALNCYTEWDQMTWSIASATETLPEETAKLVYDTVLPIGFKREQFTGLRYETCKGSQPDNRPGHGWPKREEE